MADRQVMTAKRFDALVKAPAKVEKLWGAPAIAQAIGVSADTIPALAKRADVPIFRPAGRYFAFRSELDAWLRTKPAG